MGEFIAKLKTVKFSVVVLLGFLLLGLTFVEGALSQSENQGDLVVTDTTRLTPQQFDYLEGVIKKAVTGFLSGLLNDALNEVRSNLSSPSEIPNCLDFLDQLLNDAINFGLSRVGGIDLTFIGGSSDNIVAIILNFLGLQDIITPIKELLLSVPEISALMQICDLTEKRDQINGLISGFTRLLTLFGGSRDDNILTTTLLPLFGDAISCFFEGGCKPPPDDGNGKVSTNTSGSLKIENVNMLVKGKTATTIVTLDSAPQGISGYKLTIELENCQIADIEKVEALQDFQPVVSNDPQTRCSKTITAFDSNDPDTVGPGARAIQLARVTFTSSSSTTGTSAINVIVQRLDDDDGMSLKPDVEPGTLNVTTCPSSNANVPIPFPLKTGPPNDLDEDLFCDDLNGNKRLDFDDAVILAHCFDALKDKGDGLPPAECRKSGVDYTSAFDFDRNDALNFTDAVRLASLVARTPVDEPLTLPVPRSSSLAAGGISIDSQGVPVGETATTSIVIAEALGGLSGFALTVGLSNPQVAQIQDARLTAFTGAAYVEVTSSQATLLAADFGDEVGFGSRNIVIAEVVIKGVSSGVSNIELNITEINDDRGNSLEFEVQHGLITVGDPSSGVCGLVQLSGTDASAQDLNGDGFCEDVDGNGSLTIDDAILLARTILLSASSLGTNLAFDFDGNGSIDINDAIALARRALNLEN